MSGKQAKILSDNKSKISVLRQYHLQPGSQSRHCLAFSEGRPSRQRVYEIANLTWQMIVEPTGSVSSHIEFEITQQRWAAAELFP